MASYQEQLAEYQRLRQQGISGPQAAEMVWGPGGIQNLQKNQQKEAGRAGQASAIGQVAGGLGGYYAANKAYDYLFPGKEAAAEGTKTVGEVAKGTEALSNVGGSGLPDVNASFDYKTPDFKFGGETTTINTPAGPKQVPADMANDAGFLDSVNWGKVGQGAGGALQLAQAYQMYKGGDKGGAALVGTTGVANLAASGAMGTAAASGAGSALGGYLVPGLNLAAGLYGGYQTAQAMGSMAAGSQRTKAGAMGGAASGAAIGSVITPGLGTAIGAAVGALAGATASWTGSKKGKAQTMRDGIRNVLQENQILDKDYQGTLADGSKYDFGKDGSTLKWKEIDKVAGANPNAWSPAVNLADALSAGYGFVGQKASDIAAWYAKAAVSNAGDDAEKAKANMRHFAQQQGMTYDLIKQKLDSAKADSRVTEDQYNRYLTGARDLFSGQPSQGGTPPGAPPVQQNIPRPKTGEVARLSPGIYMDDKGRSVRGKTMRDALQAAYNKTKEKKG
jgi:hypothetical protein